MGQCLLVKTATGGNKWDEIYTGNIGNWAYAPINLSINLSSYKYVIVGFKNSSAASNVRILYTNPIEVSSLPTNIQIWTKGDGTGGYYVTLSTTQVKNGNVPYGDYSICRAVYATKYEIDNIWPAAN